LSAEPSTVTIITSITPTFIDVQSMSVSSSRLQWESMLLMAM